MKKLLPLFPGQNAPDILSFRRSVRIKKQALLLGLMFMFGGLSTAIAQYDVTLPRQCNNNNPGTTEILSFPNNFGNGNGDATLTITSIGDVGTSFERLDYFNENGVMIGSSGNAGNCNNDIFTYTMPVADVNAFASDGLIEITVVPQTSVNTNQCTGQIGTAAYCSTGRLTYPVIKVPNDAGVLSIDSPVNFCAGTNNIVATIVNVGNNQINSVTVNWTFNGVPQTPVNYNQLLDTANGTAQISLGSQTFTAGILDEIVVWTSMPNGVADGSVNNDTASVNVQPSLAGTFTIDPAGSGTTNYLTFADAINDLNSFGICGAVTFNVASGTYPEQIDMGAITGSSMMNTITFQADPANTSPVDVTFSAGSANNFVIRFNGSSWVTVDGINFNAQSTFYSRTMELLSGANHLTFRNNEFNAPVSNSTSTFRANVYLRGTGFDNNVFDNNSFTGGAYGMYYMSGSSAAFNDNVQITNNSFENMYYMGLYLYGTTNFDVSNNTMSSQSSYAFGYAFYCYYGGEYNRITSNTLTTNGTNQWPLYGIRAFSYSAADSSKAVFANNMLHVGTPGVTRTNYGIYAQNMAHTDFLYNNVALEGTSTNSRAAYFLGTGGGSKILNNNFLSYGNGYGLYVNPGAASEVDHNNIASAGPNIGYYGSAAADLAAWKTAGGGDSTISVDSVYANMDSMRTCDARLAAKGKHVGSYTVDFDGDNRNPVTPNIGADEYIANPEQFTIGDSLTFCGGSELEIGTTMNGGTFQWSTGATTPTITVTQEGNYSVTVNGPCATGMTDDVEVIDVNPVANFSIGSGVFIRGFTNNSEYGSTYMWDFGDGTTSREFSPWHEYASNGSYDVTLTVMNDCDTVTITQTVSITVGVNEIELDKQISVYPNPANDFFNIAVGDIEDQTVQLEIIDMKGQVYANRLLKITAGTNETIDVSSLSKGIYMVRLTSANEVATKQVVVQ